MTELENSLSFGVTPRNLTLAKTSNHPTWNDCPSLIIHPNCFFTNMIQPNLNASLLNFLIFGWWSLCCIWIWKQQLQQQQQHSTFSPTSAAVWSSLHTNYRDAIPDIPISFRWGIKDLRSFSYLLCDRSCASAASFDNVSLERPPRRTQNKTPNHNHSSYAMNF